MFHSTPLAPLSEEQVSMVLEKVIANPLNTRNLAIILFCFKLGLNAKLLSTLSLRDVVDFNISDEGQIVLRRELRFRANFRGTRYKNWSCRAEIPNDSTRIRRLLQFTAQQGKSGSRKDFSKPLKDPLLVDALKRYLSERIGSTICGAPKRFFIVDQSEPLFLSQKNRAYSPNTMQRLIAKMLRKWSCIEGASSESGRVTFLNNLDDSERSPQNLTWYYESRFVATNNFPRTYKSPFRRNSSVDTEVSQ